MASPVIVLEFNELSPSLMNRFIGEGLLPGFAALREHSTTYTTDAEETPPNLEPWIQWVTVHTGLPFAKHKVFDLGDAHKLKAKRLWDLALEAGKKVWICGSMNAAMQSKARTDKAWFLPDPWSTGIPCVPAGAFDTFYELTARYVQEHARSGAPWSKRDYVKFIAFMFRHGLSLRTMSDIAVQLGRELRSKAYRWRRATLLDRFQWDLFRHVWKKTRPDFSTFFLNSTAHFQHYHWREFEPSLFSSKPDQIKAEARDAIPAGYASMDRIVSECLRMAPEATIVLMTALSQQPLLRYENVGGKFVFKPIDHRVLLKFAGVSGTYEYAPVMAEEFKLYFATEAAAEQAATALAALNLDGKPVMRLRRDNREIFCGCTVYSPPAADAVVRAGARSQPFSKLFFLVEGAKSGGHHPDGIFWVRRPGAKRNDVPGKIPLPDAADMLANIIGVDFEPSEAYRAEPLPLRVAS
jgi:hypothetical protein